MTFDRLTVSTITINKRKRIVLRAYKGPVLKNIDFFPINGRKIIDRWLGPGLPVPWDAFKRDGFVEIKRPCVAN